MNVVFLDVARRKERAATLNAWSPAEIGELTRLYHAKRKHGGSAEFRLWRDGPARSAILCFGQQ